MPRGARAGALAGSGGSLPSGAPRRDSASCRSRWGRLGGRGGGGPGSALGRAGDGLVVSSDLSHFLPYDEARQVDRETAAEIVGLAGPLHGRQACGARPINGLLETARRRGMTAELLDLGARETPQETPPGSWAMEPSPSIAIVSAAASSGDRPREHRRGPGARKRRCGTIPGSSARCLLHHPDAPRRAARLRRLGPRLPASLEDVRANARASAFHDTRFPPVERRRSCPELSVEVSLLSAPEPVVFRRGGSPEEPPSGDRRRHLRARGAPQHLSSPGLGAAPDPRDFLGQLKLKAGLPRSFWSPDVRLWRYTVTKWMEGE